MPNKLPHDPEIRLHRFREYGAISIGTAPTTYHTRDQLVQLAAKLTELAADLDDPFLESPFTSTTIGKLPG